MGHLFGKEGAQDSAFAQAAEAACPKVEFCPFDGGGFYVLLV
jgi:hypothetical protein